MLKKIHGSWLEYVGSIMFIINMLSKKITLWGGGAMVKDLTPQCGGEDLRFHICNLGYLGYLGDQIR
jgi:hypothetical protein